MSEIWDELLALVDSRGAKGRGHRAVRPGRTPNFATAAASRVGLTTGNQVSTQKAVALKNVEHRGHRWLHLSGARVTIRQTQRERSTTVEYNSAVCSAAVFS